MRVDDSGRVVGFLEKPQTEQELDLVRTDPAWIDAQGIASRRTRLPGQHGHLPLQPQTLVEVLEKTNYRDFGKEVFPASIRSRRVQVHLFDGYWEDIGTIKSFFEANLAHGGGQSVLFAVVGGRRRSSPGLASCRLPASTGPRSAAA